MGCVGQSVMSPEGAVTVPELALNVRNAFQEYIEKSSHTPYNLKTHSGFWRLLTVKAFARTNEGFISLFTPRLYSQNNIISHGNNTSKKRRNVC